MLCSQQKFCTKNLLLWFHGELCLVLVTDSTPNALLGTLATSRCTSQQFVTTAVAWTPVPENGCPPDLRCPRAPAKVLSLLVPPYAPQQHEHLRKTKATQHRCIQLGSDRPLHVYVKGIPLSHWTPPAFLTENHPSFTQTNETTHKQSFKSRCHRWASRSKLYSLTPNHSTYKPDQNLVLAHIFFLTLSNSHNTKWLWQGIWPAVNLKFIDLLKGLSAPCNNTMTNASKCKQI